ncbi:geminin coiled-coil domain-containing protein 1 [Mastacembelus armatus]|uniref:Geminin coiled-coil domain containing n=1 Tax=Mastacembelus armatus TaxID=205130 RepID=A0A7N8XF63_9TELE|nr:geminin coiled-coil domain-containing protein 1 [Mastacembelus armatus]
MLQHLALGPDTVDVSMATLASVWARDPCDLRETQHEPRAVWESQRVVGSSAPAGPMWTEQLSPHFHRNKQLQDTLLQREEELARLQDENNKLRQFLNSSFVRNLEEKAKKLTTDGRMMLKRNLMYVDDKRFQRCGHQPVASPQVSKRVCRNLTAEFSSECPETSTASEPNLDLWVLRTLGLKDRDTIDTSNESSPSSGYSLQSFVYNTAASSSSCSEYTLSSSFSPSVNTSAPSAHSYCQSMSLQNQCRYNAAECQEANHDSSTESSQNCTTPGQHSDFTASNLTRQCEGPDTVIGSYPTLTAYQPPPVTEDLSFTHSANRTEICSITASSQAQPVQGNPEKLSSYWSPLHSGNMPSQDMIQVSPAGERVHFCPISSSSPVTVRPWTPVRGSQPPATPLTPRSRTDLAFSMSLSPSSSVKTHSFPQGQAFVRKDTEGRWNFTWVPKQGP